MIAAQIRTLRRQKPFFPFALHLQDGRVFKVPVALRLCMTPDDRTVFVCAGRRLVEIRMGDIARVEVASEPVPDDYIEPLDDAPGERAA